MKKAAITLACVFILALILILDTVLPSKEHIHSFGEEFPLGQNENGYCFLSTCTQCKATETRSYDTLLTFIDDDGKLDAMLHWEKIMDATGIKMTAAIIPSKIEETTDYDSWWAYAGWDLLSRLGEKGMDFVSHTYNHKKLTTLSEKELHTDLQKAKATLNEHGIYTNILVYPNNAHNELVRSVVQCYYDAAFACKNKINTGTFSVNLALNRIDSNDKTLIKTISFEGGKTVDCIGVKSAEKMSAELNKARTTGGWLVYMTHAYNSPSGKYYFDEESEQSIIDFCRYAQSLKDVKIVTATQGIAASAPLPF